MVKTAACALALALLGCASSPPPRPAEARPQVVVIGGGLAGLVTAYELEKHGVSVHLLEASERLGGRMATARYPGGLHAEYGTQELWEGSPLLGIVRELGLEVESDVAFSSVLIEDEVRPFVQETADEYFSSLFSPDERAAQQRLLAEAESILDELHEKGLTPRLRQLNDISFAAWVDGQNLPPRVAEWVRATLDCEIGVSGEAFSAISGIAELRVFLYGSETANHVVGGNDRLIEALASHIRGPKTLLARATRIERTAGGLAVTYLERDRERRLEAERVVVAIPWFRLHQLQFDPPLPDDRWAAIHGIGRGQYAVVHFLLAPEAKALWPESPFPVLTRGPLGVIYGVVDENRTGEMVFGLLVYGEWARAFHMVPQDWKRRQLLEELDRLWPGFSSHVRQAAFYGYHPGAVPYWPPGRSPYDEQARALFEPFEGIRFAGDWLVSSHSEGAVVSGLRQARAIAAELAPSGQAAAPLR